jgi:hypothetical protein
MKRAFFNSFDIWLFSDGSFQISWDMKRFFVKPDVLFFGGAGCLENLKRN